MTTRLCRSLLIALAMLAPTWSAATHARPPEVPAPDRPAVELTFLKSVPGQRIQLRTFIERNWFAMDRIAQAQGLIADYTLYETGTDAGRWNVLVAVTYMDRRGYEGVAERFEEIRRAHQTQLVEGKRLGELGRIVETQRVFAAVGEQSNTAE